MSLKLSFSQIKVYTECGEKYRLHYREGYREKFFHSALAFGSAIDQGLNKLLESKMVGYTAKPHVSALQEALDEFDKVWSQQWLNGKVEELALNPNVVYAEKDFDEDLLDEFDLEELKESCKYLTDPDYGPDGYICLPMPYFQELKAKKKEIGFENFIVEERSYYNHANWLCLRKKGRVMIESYNTKIMPNIKEVLAIQHKFELSNGEDVVVAVADLVAVWKDNRRLLLDNKTAAREYDDDQASRSQQLITYYHQLKEDYKLTPAVGFIVMNKSLIKNKIKICSVCGHNGTGSKARSCDNEIEGTRCKAEWLEKCSPEAYIQLVINDVTDIAEDLVLSATDDATTGIKNEYWYKNLSKCKDGGLICPYIGVCWKGDYSNVVKTKK